MSGVPCSCNRRSHTRVTCFSSTKVRIAYADVYCVIRVTRYTVTSAVTHTPPFLPPLSLSHSLSLSFSHDTHTQERSVRKRLVDEHTTSIKQTSAYSSRQKQRRRRNECIESPYLAREVSYLCTHKLSLSHTHTYTHTHANTHTHTQYICV